jgi:hypothetical protein
MELRIALLTFGGQIAGVVSTVGDVVVLSDQSAQPISLPVNVARTTFDDIVKSSYVQLYYSFTPTIDYFR